MRVFKYWLSPALAALLVALPLYAQQPAVPDVPPPPPSSFSLPADAAPTPADTANGAAIGSATASKDYPLGPGDVLELRVFGEPQFDGAYNVDDEGNVTIPFIEPINARCRTINDVRKQIVTYLTKFLRSPQVFMRIKEQNSRQPAVVYGAVRTPLRFQMHRRVRLLELLSNSGGVTDQANGTIQITHTEANVCPEPDEVGGVAPEPVAQGLDASGLVPFTVYRVRDLKLGKAEGNPFIRPGDIVYVAEATPVYITGSVVAPQGVFLREQLSLTTAIAMVGGMRKEAKTSEVRIYRLKPDGLGREPVIADFRKIQRKQAPDIVLQPYDVVEVGERGTSIQDILLGFVRTGAQSIAQGAPLRVLY